MKKAALLRAEFNARVALARIDFKMDVIDPALDSLESMSAKELPSFEVPE